MILQGHGMRVLLPAGWEGRIFQRATPGLAFTPAARAQQGHLAAGGWAGEQPKPVLHLADFALPANRGDFGSGAVDRMGPTNIFVAALEFGSECLGSALFGSVGLPRLSAVQFDPNALQRRLPNQAGVQIFCTVNSRPICVYAVIGSYGIAKQQAVRINQLLDQVEVYER